MAATRNADSLRFLTLTMAHSDTPLVEQLDRLYDAYRNLRRTEAWKRHVVGGIATVEVERNEETGEWHPHLHVLIDGTYWDHASIKATWHAVTGDSFIAWIKAVPSRRKVANYIAKYASKPGKSDEWPHHAIREFVTAMHRRRVVIATGNMHGSKIDCDNETERDKVTDQRIPLHALERRTQLGCVRASVVLTALAQQSAAYFGSLCKRPSSLKPNLVTPSAETLTLAREAFADLQLLWIEDPVVFSVGGSGDWVKYRKPERPPGHGRMRDHTEALSDWHRKSTRHV